MQAEKEAAEAVAKAQQAAKVQREQEQRSTIKKGTVLQAIMDAEDRARQLEAAKITKDAEKGVLMFKIFDVSLCLDLT